MRNAASGTMRAVTRGTAVRDDGEGPLIASHALRLRIVEGPDRGREIGPLARACSLGSGGDNDVVLADPTVSRRHCEIHLRGGRYLLRDCNSTNGTRVNDTPVLEAYLSPGDRVILGSTAISFCPLERWERLQTPQRTGFGDLVGESETMLEVYSMLERVACTDLSCLLRGETGTGKELAARAIHGASSRAAKPFIVVDCGALSESLIEAEFFGHERGAFTGADRFRKGVFEAAAGGTVFLDEIGELPLHLQPKLLRVLERQEVRRLGSSVEISVDVRIVAATHRAMEHMVQQGAFREDLYYRLAEVIVSLPPLRERLTDLPLIATKILKDCAAHSGKRSAPRLTSSALAALQARTWPGNVRELRNTLRRVVAMSRSDEIRAEDLFPSAGSPGPYIASNPTYDRLTPAPEPYRPGRAAQGATAPQARPGSVPPPQPGNASLPAPPMPAAPLNLPIDGGLTLREARERWSAPLERSYLERILKAHDGDMAVAAEHAGIHRKSLERLLRQHGIKAADYRGT